MAISSPDKALLRGGKHTIDYYYNMWPETVVATATIDESSVIKYPTVSLKVASTSGWSGVKKGMRFVITDDDDNIITTGVVRKAPISDRLYIDAKSSGDTGWAEVRPYDILTGQTITIYNDYPLWTVFSFIKNKIFYKEYNRAYVDEGSNPAPVANIGSWRQEFVSTSISLATITMSGTASFAWGAKTISTYLWTLPAGASITVGSTSTSSVTFTLPVGFHIVTCVVTDSGGASTTARRPIWVNTASGADAPLSKSYAWSVDSDSQDLKGRVKQLTVTTGTSVDNDEYYKGAAYIFSEVAKFSGSSLSDSSVLVDKFVGFSSTEQRTGALNNSKLSMTISSPYKIFQELSQVSQVIVEKVSPTQWIHALRGIADVNFVWWYVVAYHVPNALMLFDFIRLPEGVSPRKRRYGLSGTSIAEQTDEAASYIGANSGSASDGTFYILRDPMIENTAFRDALDTRMDITDGDIVGEVSFTHKYRMNIGQYIGYGFILDAVTNKITSIGALAPGKAQPQASGKTQGVSLFVTSQTELNEKVGHLLQKSNDPIGEFSLALDRNLDIFDPAKHYNTWWDIDIPAIYNPRGFALAYRAICTSVNRSYAATNSGVVLKKITANFLREIVGLPGETIDIQVGGGGTDPDVNPDPEPIIINPDPVAGVRSIAFAWDDRIGRTYNYSSSVPSWANITGDEIVGDVKSLDISPYSPFIANGYTSGALIAYALSTDGTSIYIWKSDDVLASSVDWTLLSTQVMSDSTAGNNPMIRMSRQTPGFIAVAWLDNVNVKVMRSDDYGATWGTLTSVGDATVSSILNSGALFGMDVTSDTVITSGRNTSDEYELYYATGVSSAFTVITDSEVSASPFSIVKIKSGGGGVVTSVPDTGVSPGWTQTFDLNNYRSDMYGWSTVIGSYTTAAGLLSTTVTGTTKRLAATKTYSELQIAAITFYYTRNNTDSFEFRNNTHTISGSNDDNVSDDVATIVYEDPVETVMRKTHEVDTASWSSPWQNISLDGGSITGATIDDTLTGTTSETGGFSIKKIKLEGVGENPFASTILAPPAPSDPAGLPAYDWHIVYDFTKSPSGWTPPFWSGNPYIPGIGWKTEITLSTIAYVTRQMFIEHSTGISLNKIVAFKFYYYIESIGNKAFEVSSNMGTPTVTVVAGFGSSEILYSSGSGSEAQITIFLSATNAYPTAIDPGGDGFVYRVDIWGIDPQVNRSGDWCRNIELEADLDTGVIDDGQQLAGYGLVASASGAGDTSLGITYDLGGTYNIAEVIIENAMNAPAATTVFTKTNPAGGAFTSGVIKVTLKTGATVVAEQVLTSNAPDGEIDNITANWFSFGEYGTACDTVVIEALGGGDGGTASPTNIISRICFRGCDETNPFGTNNCGVTEELAPDGTGVLYYVNAPSGAATWTDVSPTIANGGSDYYPQTPTSVSVDVMRPSRFVMLGTDSDDVSRIITSDDFFDNVPSSQPTYDEGGAFTAGVTGIKVVGDTDVRWGGEIIEHRTGGVTSTGSDKIGDWESTIGTITNEILGIIPVI